MVVHKKKCKLNTHFVSGCYYLYVMLLYHVLKGIGGKCLDHSQADWLSTTFDVGGILGEHYMVTLQVMSFDLAFKVI